MISFNACMEACKRAGHWELALCLYDIMLEALIEADAEFKGVKYIISLSYIRCTQPS